MQSFTSPWIPSGPSSWFLGAHFLLQKNFSNLGCWRFIFYMKRWSYAWNDHDVVHMCFTFAALKQLPRRQSWLRCNVDTIGKKIMWLSATLPCLARYAFWLCHENAIKKAKFCFFSKIWISTFSHVSIFVLPCNCHAKLLSHVFAMAVFWTLKIALQQGKSHVCGNPDRICLVLK